MMRVNRECKKGDGGIVGDEGGKNRWHQFVSIREMAGDDELRSVQGILR